MGSSNNQRNTDKKELRNFESKSGILSDIQSMAAGLVGAQKPSDAKKIKGQIQGMAALAGGSAAAQLAIAAAIMSANSAIDRLEQEERETTYQRIMESRFLDADIKNLYQGIEEHLSPEERKYLKDIDPEQDYQVHVFDKQGNTIGTRTVKGWELQEAFIITKAEEKKAVLNFSQQQSLNRKLYDNPLGPQNAADVQKGAERLANFKDMIREPITLSGVDKDSNSLSTYDALLGRAPAKKTEEKTSSLGTLFATNASYSTLSNMSPDGVVYVTTSKTEALNKITERVNRDIAILDQVSALQETGTPMSSQDRKKLTTELEKILQGNDLAELEAPQIADAKEKKAPVAPIITADGKTPEVLLNMPRVDANNEKAIADGFLATQKPAATAVAGTPAPVIADAPTLQPPAILPPPKAKTPPVPVVNSVNPPVMTAAAPVISDTPTVKPATASASAMKPAPNTPAPATGNPAAAATTPTISDTPTVKAIIPAQTINEPNMLDKTSMLAFLNEGLDELPITRSPQSPTEALVPTATPKLAPISNSPVNTAPVTSPAVPTSTGTPPPPPPATVAPVIKLDTAPTTITFPTGGLGVNVPQRPASPNRQ